LSNTLKFASIDIGSNAVRLLLCNVFEDDGEPVFKKAELIRMPIRLGEDSFSSQMISEHKIDQLIDTMNAYRLLIGAFEAVDFRACATAAMREAKNSGQIISRVKEETGIQIEIIDGKTEAQIIYSNHIAEHLDIDNCYLYIDVGGGSTEVTLFARNQTVASRSFNIGTIRMLQNNVSKETWSEFKSWVALTTADYKPIIAIGSGGNINKIFKMISKKDDKPFTYKRLREMYDYMNSFSYEDRIKLLGLNPDRADVIIPATRIFLTIMKTAGIDKIIVPQVGLSDGIIHLLYEKYKNNISSENLYA
jgi:exopolyphosphatase/guanosine-5'-triphosphate,3'-diphosphate pyrophosphatase